MATFKAVPLRTILSIPGLCISLLTQSRFTLMEELLQRRWSWECPLMEEDSSWLTGTTMVFIAQQLMESEQDLTQGKRESGDTTRSFKLSTMTLSSTCPMQLLTTGLLLSMIVGLLLICVRFLDRRAYLSELINILLYFR